MRVFKNSEGWDASKFYGIQQRFRFRKKQNSYILMPRGYRDLEVSECAHAYRPTIWDPFWTSDWNMECILKSAIHQEYRWIMAGGFWGSSNLCRTEPDQSLRGLTEEYYYYAILLHWEFTFVHMNPLRKQPTCKMFSKVIFMPVLISFSFLFFNVG